MYHSPSSSSPSLILPIVHLSLLCDFVFYMDVNGMFYFSLVRSLIRLSFSLSVGKTLVTHPSISIPIQTHIAVWKAHYVYRNTYCHLYSHTFCILAPQWRPKYVIHLKVCVWVCTRDDTFLWDIFSSLFIYLFFWSFVEILAVYMFFCFFLNLVILQINGIDGKTYKT